MTFDIRQATQDDFEDLLRLNKALFDYELSQGFTATANPGWTYSDDGKKAFQKYLDNENSNVWVAESNGVVVGYLAGTIAIKTFCIPNVVGEVENMFVDEQSRSSGLGAALVEEFKKWAEEKKAGILVVSAWFDNVKARKFYQKQGFRPAAVMHEMTLDRHPE